MPNFCSVEGCNKPCHGLGYCNTHYRRYKRHGDTSLHLKPVLPLRYCKVDGCGNLVHTKGYCSKHWSRLQRGGELFPRERDKSGVAAANPREYKTWVHLKERCYNKNAKEYPGYGGRGIIVCERWLEKPYGFRNFLEDMGKKPGPEYSIDRIDNNGPYSPENCRWATAKEQANNRRVRRDTRFYAHDDETKTLKEWSEITGIPWSKLRCRYYSKTFDKSKLLDTGDFRVKS